MAIRSLTDEFFAGPPASDAPLPTPQLPPRTMTPSPTPEAQVLDLALQLQRLAHGGLTEQQVVEIVRTQFAQLPKALNAAAVSDIVRDELKAFKPTQSIDEVAVRRIATEVAAKYVNRVEIVVNGKPATTVVDNAHAYLPLAAIIAAHRIPLFLLGERGTGKTTLAEQLARAMDLPFHVINCTRAMTPGKLVGFAEPFHGKWMRGELSRHVDKPGLILCDELDASDPGTQLVLNSAVGNRYIGEPDGLLRLHEDFMIMAAGNTINGATKAYNGREKIDAALADRFAVLELPIDNAIEARLCGDVEVSTLDGRPDKGGFITATAWKSDVRAVRTELKKKGMETAAPSPRAAEYGAKLCTSVGRHWLNEMFLIRGGGQDVRGIVDATLSKNF